MAEVSKANLLICSEVIDVGVQARKDEGEEVGVGVDLEVGGAGEAEVRRRTRELRRDALVERP